MCLLPTTSPGLLYCLLPPQAYCHPHSLTEYNLYMKRLEDDAMTRARFRRRVLCHSLAGNAVELLTITSFTADPEALKSRKGVVPQPAGGVARLSPRLAPYCWQRPVGSALLAAPCWHRPACTALRAPPCVHHARAEGGTSCCHRGRRGGRTPPRISFGMRRVAQVGHPCVPGGRGGRLRCQ